MHSLLILFQIFMTTILSPLGHRIFIVEGSHVDDSLRLSVVEEVSLIALTRYVTPSGAFP